MKRARTSRWWNILLVVLFFGWTLAFNFVNPRAAVAAGTTYTATSTTTIRADNFPECSPTKVFTEQSAGTYVAQCGVPRSPGVTYKFVISGISGPDSNGNYAATIKTITGGAGSPNGPIDIKGNGIKLAGSATPNPDAGNQSNSPECTDSNDPLSWIICPIFQAAADSSEWILNTIVTPFLLTQPIDTSANNPLYQVWSNFRLYGDIFLVIALLVLVFGQSIGGGLVDAYTVKKALPRVLVAAILVNLSIYIMAFMIDITNVIGKSIGEIMIAPFKAAGSWHFTPNAAQGIGVLSVGIIGFFLARGGILAFLQELFSGTKNGKVFSALGGHGSFGREALVAGLLIAVPMFLAILAVFVTLLIRKGLILFLVLASAVAFALYALPNTEQYFRKFWSLWLEALMVFPIIIIVFATADILSLTILSANGVTSQSFSTGVVQGTASFLAILVAFVLQFLPLFMIPFAFRMAGGILGRLHEMVANTHGKVANMGAYKHAREHAQQTVSDRMIQRRNQSKQEMFARADAAAPGSLEQRRLTRRARWMSGRGIEQKISEVNQRKRQEQELNTGHGPDDFRRASTIDHDLLHAAEHGGVQAVRDQAAANGWTEDEDFRMNDGQLQLASLGGKFYGVATASQAAREFHGDQGALQYNLQYEMGKSIETKQKQRIKSKYGHWAKSQGWGNNTSNERWIGAAYGRQQQDKDYKFLSIGDDGELRPSNALGQITEMNREEDPFAWGRHTAETYNELGRNVGHAADVLQYHRDVAAGVANPRGVASHGMFVSDADGTAQQKAQQYMEEVGKHVAFLETPSPGYTDPETGQVQAGGQQRMLYSGAPDTSMAAQRLANMFHHRGGEWTDVAANEVAGKNAVPQEGQYSRGSGSWRGPTTEEGVSGTSNANSPTTPGTYPPIGQIPRSMNVAQTAEQAAANPAPQGSPMSVSPGHIYEQVRPGGGLTGTGGLNSYMRGESQGPPGSAQQQTGVTGQQQGDNANGLAAARARRRGGAPEPTTQSGLSASQQRGAANLTAEQPPDSPGGYYEPYTPGGANQGQRRRDRGSGSGGTPPATPPADIAA